MKGMTEDEDGEKECYGKALDVFKRLNEKHAHPIPEYILELTE